MSKFTEAKLEKAIINLLSGEAHHHYFGEDINRNIDEVLIEDDLRDFLKNQYPNQNLSDDEISSIIRKLRAFTASDLYDSNRKIIRLIQDGFTLKRDDRSQKDLHIQLIDYTTKNKNIFKLVTQMEIIGLSLIHI